MASTRMMEKASSSCIDCGVEVRTNGHARCRRCAVKMGAERLMASRPPEVRFWEKVERLGPDDCWEWVTMRGTRKYGVFNVNGKRVYAHRFSYELHHEPIPEGMCICHTCDNPPCCNPAHLFIGTRLDNNLDCERKGRYSQGERHVCAKLTNDQVREIRARYAAGGVTHRDLAQEYGVNRQTIGNIVNRINWKGVA